MKMGMVAWERIRDRAGEIVPASGKEQGGNEVGQAMAAAGAR